MMDFPAHLHAHRPQAYPLTFALAIVALVYLRGWFRFRREGAQSIPLWRVAAFIGGLFFIWAAVGSPLASLDHELLTLHMIDHLVLMTVAAPLLLVGNSSIQLHMLWAGLGGDIGPGASHHDSVFFSVRMQRFARFLANPVFCWIIATATVIGWHLPSVFQLAHRYRPWHDLQSVSFLTAGLLFWGPVMKPALSASEWPDWSRIFYLFLATLPCDILSAFLVFCGRVVYPAYLSAQGVPSQRLLNLSPLQDQQCAGALMWVWVTFAYLLPAFLITVKILSPNSPLPMQQRLDTNGRLAQLPFNGRHPEGA
jgi:cytochrome c oxidase assembly factor CtaG